jgi:hypothetical protein
MNPTTTPTTPIKNQAILPDSLITPSFLTKNDISELCQYISLYEYDLNKSNYWVCPLIGNIFVIKETVDPIQTDLIHVTALLRRKTQYNVKVPPNDIHPFCVLSWWDISVCHYSYIVSSDYSFKLVSLIFAMMDALTGDTRAIGKIIY